MGLLNRIWEFCLGFSFLYSFSHDDQAPNFLPAPQHVSKHCKNDPQHRYCWRDGFNIHTDYEDRTPWTGNVKNYTLVLSEKVIDPDGYNFSSMVINGSYPGPLIEADWGDTLRVTVVNNLTNDNGTSIHWHGVRQLNTNWQDGVTGVTQCPIPPGGNWTYEFKVMQYGVSWYHSHFSLQYPDGIAGPLKFNGPTSMNYDDDLGPILLTDWFHTDAFALFFEEITGGPPSPDSNLLNGAGYYPCCPTSKGGCTGKVPEFTTFEFRRFRTYKMSIVNTAAVRHFTFWIDGHKFWVVGTDFVPIKPWETDTINVAIGQRYDIIVIADADLSFGTDFWIHARDCGDITQTSTLGIIRYNSTSRRVPWTPPPTRLCYGCLDEPRESLIPVVPRFVGLPKNPDYQDGFLYAALESYPDPSVPLNVSHFHRWVLGNRTFQINWMNPSLELMLPKWEYNCSVLPDPYSPICINEEIETGGWVYWLIQGNLSHSERREFANEIPAAHPIHLHGHDFVILDQQTVDWDPDKFRPTLRNPTRRDVVMLPTNGYVVIAFQVDNPGAWLMHCHIAFHASAGLAVQFVEQPDKLWKYVDEAGVWPSFQEQCAQWRYWYTTHNIPDLKVQEDSGI